MLRDQLGASHHVLVLAQFGGLGLVVRNVNVLSMRLPSHGLAPVVDLGQQNVLDRAAYLTVVGEPVLVLLEASTLFACHLCERLLSGACVCVPLGVAELQGFLLVGAVGLLREVCSILVRGWGDRQGNVCRMRF